MSEWIANSPFSSVLGIIIAVIILIVVSKMVHDITRPIFLVLVIAAGIMIFYNVIDLTLLASTGQKLLTSCLGCGVEDNGDGGKTYLIQTIIPYIFR